MKQISTNNWNILDGERIRRWPSPFGGKRGISVDMYSWVGVSPWARHIEITVDEEKNQWWSESENAWISIYSDSTASGYSLRASVYTEKEAKKVSDYFVKLIKNNNKDTEYKVTSTFQGDDYAD